MNIQMTRHTLVEATAPVHIVLASQSPRRRELLALIGIPHDVHPADIDESVLPAEEPVPHCARLARTKASVLAERYPDRVVVGADTIVVVDGAILGKPVDAQDARVMLRRLSGRTHTVFTAVAVACGAESEVAVEEVAVTFRELDESTIDAYIATGEPMDKAGAYGIQGYGATIVRRVDGDYFAVMGLPLARLIDLLGALGFRYAFGPPTRASA